MAMGALVAPTMGLVADVSNVDERRDVTGAIVNAHSGGLYRFGDTFYLYGTAYLPCVQPGPICNTSCGYFNNTFVVRGTSQQP